MAKLVRSSRNEKDIMDLIKESSDLNPMECNGYQNNQGAYVIKSVYPNGLWKKEISYNSRTITKYSAKVSGRIVYFETSQINVPLESIHNQVMDMFDAYNHGKLWVD